MPAEQQYSNALHSADYATLTAWVKSAAPRSPPAIFLYGPPGVGKTTLAHRVVNDAGLRAVECNASQFRHKAAMSELIEPLLHSANVSDFFRPEGHRPLGVILDEIDGMSTGDRGGLAELVRILKDYKGPNAIICISNEWQEKRYQPLMRLALCRQISPPDLESCAAWMGRTPAEIQEQWVRHRGDLRKLQQWAAGAGGDNETANDISRSLSVHDLVMKLLDGELDLQDEPHFDNIDLNMVGLHLHETLPSWIRVHYGTDAAAWHIYRDCLRFISTSDRQDYYTFFHQHWSLFPLSFQSKLQAVNYRLFVAQRPPKKIAPSPSGTRGWKYEYSAVLARQSWLFNQFKYLCEVRDLLQTSPLRDGGLEAAMWCISLLNTVESQGDELLVAGQVVREPATVPRARVQRWLSTLAVPRVPPCPIGKFADSPMTPKTVGRTPKSRGPASPA